MGWLVGCRRGTARYESFYDHDHSGQSLDKLKMPIAECGIYIILREYIRTYYAFFSQSKSCWAFNGVGPTTCKTGWLP